MPSKTALTIDDEIELEKEFTRQIYRSDLFLTAQELLGYKDLTWRTHGPVCEALQAETKRKLIVLPRGTFKSSLCSVAYPIWLLMRDPNLRIMLDSELFGNSSQFLREIKLHMKGEPFIKLFGDWEGPVWNDSQIIIKPRTKILKEASITASGIGAEKTSYHTDVVIMDDLNSPNNSQTPEGRRKVIQHYKYTVGPILEPHGIAVLVGTRYASDDALGHVMKSEIEPEKEEKRGLLSPTEPEKVST